MKKEALTLASSQIYQYFCKSADIFANLLMIYYSCLFLIIYDENPLNLPTHSKSILKCDSPES